MMTRQGGQPAFAIRVKTWQSFLPIAPGEVRAQEVIDHTPLEMLGFSGETALEDAAAVCEDYRKRQDGDYVVLATGMSVISYKKDMDLSGMDFSHKSDIPCAIIAIDESGLLVKFVLVTGPDATAKGWEQFLRVSLLLNQVKMPKAGHVYFAAIEAAVEPSGQQLNFDHPTWFPDNRGCFTVQLGKSASRVFEYEGDGCCAVAHKKALEMKSVGIPDGDRLVVCAMVYRKEIPTDENEIVPTIVPGYDYMVSYTHVGQPMLWYFSGPSAGEAAARQAFNLTQDRVDGLVTIGIVMTVYEMK